MSKRIKAKIGDIFKVTLDDNQVGFFQFILLDPAEMNSEVIRVFNLRLSKNESINLDSILQSDVEFYAHVVISFGYDLNLWESIGNIPLEKEFTPPKFRAVFGIEHEFNGNQIVFKRTDKWQSWRSGDSFESRINIGFITEETIDIALGGIHPPNEIINKMQTGDYKYPNYT